MLRASCNKDHILFGGAQVRTLEELQAVVDAMPSGQTVLCSSSMDWPKDYTDDAEIIFLCDLLRGNNVSGRNPEFRYIERQEVVMGESIDWTLDFIERNPITTQAHIKELEKQLSLLNSDHKNTLSNYAILEKKLADSKWWQRHWNQESTTAKAKLRALREQEGE